MTALADDFSRLSANAIHASAARTMWKAVAAHTLSDAAADVARSNPNRRESVIQIQLRYFRSRDWHQICSLADLTPRYGGIEAFLRSNLVSTSRSIIYRNLGLPQDRTPEGDDE